MKDESTGRILELITEERCRESLTALLRIKSVVGEPTTMHEHLAAETSRLGMLVEQYAVEDAPTPLVLAELGGGPRAGVLFDNHYDTVAATASDWEHDPWGGVCEDGNVYGRGAVDSKGSLAAMLVAIEAIVDAGVALEGPIFLLSDSDGERGMRGVPMMSDLGLRERIGTVLSGEATSNSSIDLAYPGLSAWKITARGRTAHPTEPDKGINAITAMARLVTSVERGELKLRGGSSDWFEPRVTTNAIRTRPGGGWAIPDRCDAVLSFMTPAGVSLRELGEDIERFLESLEEELSGPRFEKKIIPMGGGRLWLRPGESDPAAAGVEALRGAVERVTGKAPRVGPFLGGWVPAAELMRQNGRYASPAVLTFGPGDFAEAHTVDEHVPLAEVVAAARIYADATVRLLG